jgi:NAD(P)-dependent dehydrogenase (short-subunit alcohol dehydrogenase family)
MTLEDRTILVAGGSSGLGAACVRRLAGRGARVVIADIDPAGERLADELGDRAIFTQMDVTDEASVARAVGLAVDRFGGLRGAVACAGILGTEKVLGREGIPSLLNFRRVIEVNLVGTFNVVRHAANAIREQAPEQDGERGVIVTTSSIAADEGQIGQAAYAARELARHGIRIVSVAPGVFETPMMAACTPEVRQSLVEQIPFPARFGDPEEFAALIEHIFENRMLNGSTIRLDGAMRMQAR